MRIGMSRRSAKLVAAVLAVVAVCCFAPRHAQGAEGVPYTSLWGDYTTSIPAGWTVSYDCEGAHYTDTAFRPSGESGYALAIRWYTRYATHHTLDGGTEMYGDADNYMKYTAVHLYGGGSVEPTREVEAGGLKLRQFVVPYPKPANSLVAEEFWFLIGDDVCQQPGQHAYTFVTMSHGFYVLIYYAPQGGYERYEKQYQQMVVAFAAKYSDYGPELASAERPRTFEWDLAVLKSQRNLPVTTRTYSVADGPGGGGAKINSNLFGNTNLRKEVITLVSGMKPAPAIPEEATRDFVRGVTFVKAAKQIADYSVAVDAFKDALSSAPWWGDAYYNLGIALESAGRYDEATEAIKLYLATKPGESDASQAQQKIYAIEAEKELAAKKKTELSSRLSSAESTFNNGNYGQALEVFREVAKAADEGGAEERVALQVYKDLGFVYREGKGVAQDYAEAAKWWRKAAEKGDAPAQCELGLAYYYGRGVNLDYAEAVKWYRKAVEQGNAAAMCCLGVCYRTGNGVPRDRAEAVNWYRKAAKAGSTTAQDNLREMGEK